MPFLLKPRTAYLFFLLTMILVFIVYFSSYRMHVATIKEGERVTIQLDKVVCAGFKDSRNYIVFSRDNANHIVNVGRAKCGDYREGDTATVLYNKQSGLYFPLHLDTTDDWWGMVLSGLGALAAVGLLVLKRRK